MVWGTYYFTTDGKDIKLPYQSTMHVTNGKIDRSIIYFDLLSVFKTWLYAHSTGRKQVAAMVTCQYSSITKNNKLNIN